MDIYYFSPFKLESTFVQLNVRDPVVGTQNLNKTEVLCEEIVWIWEIQKNMLIITIMKDRQKCKEDWTVL